MKVSYENGDRNKPYIAWRDCPVWLLREVYQSGAVSPELVEEIKRRRLERAIMLDDSGVPGIFRIWPFSRLWKQGGVK